MTGRALAGAAALVLAGCTSVAADHRTFTGTSWQVTAINGHPTPLTNSYRIEFAARQISGRVGCNRFTADYRVLGQILTTSGLGGTEMACGQPAMTFEQWGYEVLRAPLRMEWGSDRRLTLANERGSIILELVD